MLNIRAGTLIRRSRVLGLVTACALGVSLTGCVAYDGGGYGGGYAGGGYGGGYYGGGGSVNVYAPAYYRAGYRGHGGYNQNPRHDGGGHHGNWNGGGQSGGGRPEAHHRRQERGQSYGG